MVIAIVKQVENGPIFAVFFRPRFVKNARNKQIIPALFDLRGRKNPRKSTDRFQLVD